MSKARQASQGPRRRAPRIAAPRLRNPRRPSAAPRKRLPRTCCVRATQRRGLATAAADADGARGRAARAGPRGGRNGWRHRPRDADRGDRGTNVGHGRPVSGPDGSRRRSDSTCQALTLAVVVARPHHVWSPGLKIASFRARLGRPGEAPGDGPRLTFDPARAPPSYDGQHARRPAPLPGTDRSPNGFRLQIRHVRIRVRRWCRDERPGRSSRPTRE